MPIYTPPKAPRHIPSLPSLQHPTQKARTNSYLDMGATSQPKKAGTETPADMWLLMLAGTQGAGERINAHEWAAQIRISKRWRLRPARQ